MAKKIAELRQSQNVTWATIGERLQINPEAARSILRRYESDLNNDINLLNIFDNEISENDFLSKKTKKKCEEIDNEQKENGYGQYLYLTDLHEPYAKRRTIKQILLKPEVKKIKKLIIGGDVLQMDVAAKWVVDKDELYRDSIKKGKEDFEVFANEFEEVIVIEGNHDKWPKRELLKRVPNGMKCIVSDISPIKTIIEELEIEQNIKNIKFTFGNELMLGNVMFCHPDDFASAPGRTVCNMVDTYLPKFRNLSAVAIGHTHHVFTGIYRTVAVYENGCLCHEMDYHTGAKTQKNMWTTAYGIYTIATDGNIVTDQTQVVSIL